MPSDSPGLGLTNYSPAYGIKAIDTTDDNSATLAGRRDSVGGGRGDITNREQSNENESASNAQKAKQPNESANESASNLKATSFAQRKHQSSRLRALEAKRSRKFAKYKSSMKEQEIKNRADTTANQDMRYIDVVKVVGTFVVVLLVLFCVGFVLFELF